MHSSLAKVQDRIVTRDIVFSACAVLQAEGSKVTRRAVLGYIGFGGMSSINRYVKEWSLEQRSAEKGKLMIADRVSAVIVEEIDRHVRAALEVRESEFVELQEENVCLNSSLAEAEKRIDDVSSELHRVTEQYKANEDRSEKELLSAQERLSASNTELVAAKEECKAAAAEKEKALGEVARLSRECGELKSTVTMLERQNMAQGQRLQELEVVKSDALLREAAAVGKVEAMKENLKGLKDLLAESRQEKGDLVKTLEAINRKLTETSTQLAVASARIELLQKDEEKYYEQRAMKKMRDKKALLAQAKGVTSSSFSGQK